MSNLHEELNAAIEKFSEILAKLEVEHGVEIEVSRFLIQGERGIRTEVKKRHKFGLKTESEAA